MIRLLSIAILLTLLSVVSLAQSSGGRMSYETYRELKEAHRLPDMSNIEVVYTEHRDVDVILETREGEIKASSSCYGYSPPGPGASRETVEDDESVGVTLNFDFCFYGDTYTSVWVNDNGNITFGSASGTFTASGFPISNDKMIAPFWADFHQGFQGGNGFIWYENLPTALIVHWEDVGYYADNTDKRNTMMLVITDGVDPLLSPGNNVGFFYQDMQWTTGDFSFGTNGFGGIPATVGINKGDGVNFIQIGRFDQAGAVYDGAYGNSDGVDWLDNKSLMFDVCSATNIPPIVADIEVCDTLYLCVNDTLDINFSIVAGEIDQTAEIVLDQTNISNYTVVSNTSANTAVLESYIVGTISNIGLNTLSVMAFDDGNPADTIWFDLQIKVDTIPFHPTVSGSSILCYGETTLLDANSGFEEYTWSNGETTEDITVGPGTYTLAARILGCTEYVTHVVDQYPRQLPIIDGDSIICVTGNPLIDITTLFVDSTYASYLWTPNGETTWSIDVPIGTYGITTVDTNGCQEISAQVNVSDFSTAVAITGPDVYCEGDSALLDAGLGFDSYLWNTGNAGDTLQTLYVFAGSYEVTITDSICSATVEHTVSEEPEVIPVIIGDDGFCPNLGPVTLTASGGTFTGYEWFPNGETTQSISAMEGDYQVAVDYSVCKDTSLVFTVVQFPDPVINLSSLNFVCTGDSILATESSQFPSYSWSTGDTISSIYISQGGNYTLTIADDNNCVKSQTITIDELQQATVAFDPITCDQEFQFMANTAIENVSWSVTSGPGNVDFSPNNSALNPYVSVDAYGTYTLTMNDLKCNKAYNVVIDFEGVPEASMNSIEICHDDTVVFDVTQEQLDVVSYDWNTGSDQPILSTSIEGTYMVDITGYCGSITDSAYVKVYQCVVPNVITPNGDGQNDYFYTRFAELYDDVELVIYNRWGRVVYRAEGYDNTWNGQRKDSDTKVAAGTYYYIIKWNEASHEESGVVTVFDSK